MAKTIEPPILISRLMIFVFAASVVMLVVLILTLVKMYPLDRTQILFLASTPKSDTTIQLTSFTPNGENLETYKIAFIKEYIKARNEIVPNATVMKRKWSASNDGIVYMWSSPTVYKDFQQTGMWNAYMQDIPTFEFYCPVEFNSISPWAENSYSVKFSYFCTDKGGQTSKNYFTIVLKLELENAIQWTDRLQNPLGIKVTEYSVQSGQGDPLDFKWAN